MSEPGDADVRAVLARFGMSAAVADPLGHAGGFSGARLWRIRSTVRDYCLKCWPEMRPDRHAGIARLVRAARAAGLRYIPSLTPTDGGDFHVEHGRRLWDLADWMPGTADFRAHPSPARLRAACKALARLHRVWEEIAGPSQPCPAVIRRLIAAGEWLDGTVCSTGWQAPGRLWAERAWRIIEWRLPAVPRLLEAWRSVPLCTQPCLCDIWHDHVLFTGAEVTGIIDFGAVKLDNVAADLARLLGSLAGDDDGLYESGLDAYAAVRPLSDSERRLVRVLDRTGVVLGLANWLRKGQEFDDQAAVAARMSELVLRAERWE